MPAITGLRERTKEELTKYCTRQGVTQVAWVESHLQADLEKEKEEEGKNVE